MDDTELSARSGPEGQEGGSTSGRTSGEVTTDEGTSITDAFEAGFVLGGGQGDVVEVGTPDGGFQPAGAAGHPDHRDLSPDDIRVTDAEPPPLGDQTEELVLPEELAPLVDDPNLLIDLDERGFDASDVPDGVTPEPPDLEGDTEPGGP